MQPAGQALWDWGLDGNGRLPLVSWDTREVLGCDTEAQATWKSSCTALSWGGGCFVTSSAEPTLA